MRTFFPALGTIFLVVIFTSAGAANEAKPPEVKLAAAFQLPQIPGLSGPSVDWRQWDSFFTFVVKQFGQEMSGDLKDSLGEVFLDSRYELSSAISGKRWQSGARAVCKRLEKTVADPQQGSAGIIPTDRQPIPKLYQRSGQARSSRPTGFSARVVATNTRYVTRHGAPPRT